MSMPAMYYLGCGFNWLLMLLSIGGYFYILNRAGKKWAFMLIFAAAWVVFGISYVFLLSGVSSGEWYITLIRTIGYVLLVATIVSSIVELAGSKKRG